jgi:hypothetical protein
MKTLCIPKIIFFILLILTSCEVKTEFNQKEWGETFDGSYPKRKKLTDIILESKILNKQNIDTAKSKYLGQENYLDSTNKDTIKYSYLIEELYGFDIDPQYSSYLEVLVSKKTKTIFQVRKDETQDRRSLLEKMIAN